MRYWFKLEWVAAVCGAGILIYLLFGHPFIGVADNGDFLRVIATSGLNYDPDGTDYRDRFFGYAHMHYAYETFRGAYISTQIIPVIIARYIGWIWDRHLFDIRVLALIYMILMASAAYLIVRTGKTSSRAAGIVLAAAVLFVFFDIGYAAYFNSFYGEPVSFLFLLLTAGTGMMLAGQERPSPKLLAAFFVCVLMLACSKIQNTPIGIVFALYGLRFVRLRYDWSWRKLVLICCAGLFVLSAAMYVFAPKQLKHINIYQTVFYGILNGSPDIEGDLKALGLPPELAVNAGTNFFQTDTVIKQDAPEMKAMFYDRISHKDVLLYYLTHPQRLLQKMDKAAGSSMTIRPYYLGNYEKEVGKPYGAIAYAYSGWSELKRQYMPHSLLFIILFYALYYAVALIEYARSISTSVRIRIELLMLVGFVGFFSFIVPILGDGLADLEKHLFLFNVAFDMMAVTAVVWVVYRIARLVRPKPAYEWSYK
ncbi:hypothetical protein [Paenibacillus beijingensis]|uniref:Glycosyltransferase RgtA/B/C/D-like domain-containing protein n=1 Tax=Paenibacillus beijingensis TaxID=1126833 RepID=A0A0D5NJN4_9BACL|nr:hypothetical protein [Paenibacillus beijingensis]AJY75481.1 hypothetical protein VN24_14020 [Paenibacillus beijingensis]